MNGNKVARVLNRIFSICFFLCMALIFFGTFFYGYTKRTDTNTFGDLNPKRILYSTHAHLIIYFAAVLLLVFFCVLYYLSKKDYRLTAPGKMSNEKKFRIILFTVVGIMLAIELYMGWEMRIYRSHDLAYVGTNSDTFAYTGSFQELRNRISSGEDIYMARYPNNFAIMFFLALLYRVWYLLFGNIPLYAPVVVNCIAIVASVLFTVLIAKHMWGRRKALVVLVMLFIFSPLYLYVPLYYTDTLSMPFGIIGLYWFILAIKKDKSQRFKKYLLLFLAGAILLIGYKVKGNIAVILAAMIVYALVKCKIKEFACIALALILGFGSFMMMFKAGYSYLNLVSEESVDHYEYPYTHWVMMGLNGLGGYNKKDSVFTAKIDGKQEKAEANIEQIKIRLKKHIKDNTLISHFVNKALWMWTDGTYTIPGHLKTYVQRSWMHEFFLRNGKYYTYFFAYASAYQLLLAFLMMISALKGIIKSKINSAVLLRGIVFALFIFLLIWEGRSRYLFNLTPVFILVSADGLFSFSDTIGKWFSKLRNKKEKSAKTRFIEDAESSETEAVSQPETPESDPDTNTEESVSDSVPATT